MIKESWLPLTEDELDGEIFIMAVAEEKLRQNGFSEGTIRNIDIELDKFKKIGEEPFYRLSFRAAGSINQPTEAVKILFLLMGHYGAHGGSSMSKAYPVEMIHNFRGNLFEKGAQLAGFLDTVTPEDVKPQNRPRPPAP